MCRTCKAENPKWSKGIRVPVKDLPMFFAAQPSWNFEQKIYGHNVVITERARPTLTGRLGCHDIEGVIHRRQDHFLVREIFHCPGKKYNCSPRVACTGRRRHCYGLCKVTVYSANKNIAIVQFAGGHGTGAIQRRAWPYNGHQYDIEPSSPPENVSKKESKMRAILGSPTAHEQFKAAKSRSHKSKSDPSTFRKSELFSGFGGVARIKDENTNFNMGGQGQNGAYHARNVYDHAMNSSGGLINYPNQMYTAGYSLNQLLTPEMSPEERLKHELPFQNIHPHHQNLVYPSPTMDLSRQTPTSSSQSVFLLYQESNAGIQMPQQNFSDYWNVNGGTVMNPQYPITPPDHPTTAATPNLLPANTSATVPHQPHHQHPTNHQVPIKQEIVVEDPRNTTLSLDNVKGQDSYIPTLSEVNSGVDDLDPAAQLNCYTHYDMQEPHPLNTNGILDHVFQKRKKIDSSVETSSMPASSLNSTLTSSDIWRPYLSDFTDIKLESSPVPSLTHDIMNPQDNFISFMLRDENNMYNSQHKLTKL